MLASYICQIENKTVTSNTQDEWETRLWYSLRQCIVLNYKHYNSVTYSSTVMLNSLCSSLKNFPIMALLNPYCVRINSATSFGESCSMPCNTKYRIPLAGFLSVG